MTATATATRQIFATREEWLTAAVEYLNLNIFEPAGLYLPEVRVSVGWPGGGSVASQISVGAQCWTRRVAADGRNQIFVTPLISDAEMILGFLGHELIHAIDDCAHGHKGVFAQWMRRVGYEGKMTHSEPGEALAAKFAMIAIALGEYPHAALGMTPVGGEAGPRVKPTPDDSAEGPKAQKARMLKVVCDADSGYTVRMTRMWIDTYGTPICPCHNHEMIEA